MGRCFVGCSRQTGLRKSLYGAKAKRGPIPNFNGIPISPNFTTPFICEPFIDFSLIWLLVYRYFKINVSISSHIFLVLLLRLVKIYIMVFDFALSWSDINNSFGGVCYFYVQITHSHNYLPFDNHKFLVILCYFE